MSLKGNRYHVVDRIDVSVIAIDTEDLIFLIGEWG